MDEASVPLLEKRQPGGVGAANPRRKSWAAPVLWLAASLLLALGLFLALFSRGEITCWTNMAATTPTETIRQVTPSSTKRDSVSASASPTSQVLECFQVAQPVLTPAGATTSSSSAAPGNCTVTLMEHIFAYSYGAPFVGNYVPPSCSFNRVVINFTVVSEGRQFDRIALMYLNDTEVWRTSTAEPVKSPGIRWVYLKDVTEYLALWQSPQKIIFDLGNLVNDKYTGTFNTTLTATFFTSDVDTGGAPPSDLVIPISARNGASGGVSQFTLPVDNATNTISFPRNANRAVFSVSANGQSNEEFWWSNVLQSDVLTFRESGNTLTGLSPFREVQLYIDGQLAGVQWPFPVVFTGGVVPSLHRPIVGADVFDLREHEIDITPWLPVLCDGQQHTFTIQVAGLEDDGKTTAVLTQTVAASWYVTGKIFVWLDEATDAITTGSAPVVSGTAPTISVSQTVLQNATGSNETLQYSVSVLRTFSVQGQVTSRASSGPVTWTQELSYTNVGTVTDFGTDQINNLSLHGSDKAVAGAYSYSTDYAFPLYCNTTQHETDQGNLTIWAQLDQGLTLQVSGAAVFPTGLEAFAGAEGGRTFAGGSLLHTWVNGTALYQQTGDGRNSTGFGSTTQTLQFGGLSAAGVLGSTPDIPLYRRTVTAVNQTIVFDDEAIAGVATATLTAAATVLAGPDSVFAQAPQNGGTGPRVFMGRGGSDAATAEL